MQGTVAAGIFVTVLSKILVHYSRSSYKASTPLTPYQFIITFIITDGDHIPQQAVHTGAVLHFSLTNLIIDGCHHKRLDRTCRIHFLIIYIYNISCFQIFYINRPVSTVVRSKTL